MTAALYQHLKELHENQLWSNLCQTGGVFLTMMDNRHHHLHAVAAGGVASPASAATAPSDEPVPSTSSAPPATPPAASASSVTLRQHLHALCLVADAQLECRAHAKAERLYKEALQVRRQLARLAKADPAAPAESAAPAACDVPAKAVSDGEIKFQLHKCYLGQGQPGQASQMLQSISAKQRTAKCHMALGVLYQRAGMERPAITCFREVLKACPLAVEAAQRLMQLGIKAKEIQELTLEATSGVPSLDWFSSWSQAYAAFSSRDYPQAIAAFQQLEDRPLLRNDPGLILCLGQAQYYHGDYQSARLTLQRLHQLDSTQLPGMDALAALLAKERKAHELELLATKLMALNEDAPEAWIAMGYFCYINKKGSRALYFAHKACMLHNRSVEALLLKGNVLLDLKKVPDAITHFREAMQLAPNRYELHKGLIDCYLAQSRHREATSFGATACKQLNNSARALTLFANVLIKDPFQLSLSRARGLLQKALQADQTYLPAVYLLAELLEQDMSHQEAIDLLQKQLHLQSTCRLHQMLADLLAKTHDQEKAMEHYTIALNLDPKNAPAQEGLQKIEQSTDNAPLEVTYDLEMEDMNSDEADLEESETEAVWSDGDLNLAASNSSSRYL